MTTHVLNGINYGHRGSQFSYVFNLCFDLQWTRSPGKKGSHFHPDSDLFLPKEKKDVITSTACWSAMVAVLAGLTWKFGLVPVIMLYGIPYLVGLLTLLIMFTVSESIHGFLFYFIFFVNFVMINSVVLNADIRHVVGFCNILASSWA